jgi:hypothetical protein
MTILEAVREQLTRRRASTEPRPPPRDRPAGSAEEAQLPFDGYDRLDEKRVMDGLSDHSQVELEAVESYERSHKSRDRVLNKLRYMRGNEPLSGYDALGVGAVLAALKEADHVTIKKVRGYERKFANRPDVLDEVGRLHHQHVKPEPATAARP